MAVVKIYDQDKAEKGELTLSADVFEVAIRPEILHLVVRAHLAAKRAGTHSVKTRAFVSGGGRKPFRQKGTGNARAGSNRSPIWRGGAVIFGPQPRDYGFKVNKKIKKMALRMALSARLQSEGLLVVNDIKVPDAKTKQILAIVKNLGLGKALIVAPEETRELVLSTRNIQSLTITTPERLNVYEILRHKHLVLLEGAVNSVESRLK